MLLCYLKNIPDARRAQGRRFALDKVLAISIIAMLCGATSYRGIHAFMKGNFEEIKEQFGLNWKKPPAYTTIRKIIMKVDTNELERCFREYSHSLSSKTSVISIDGKSLRGSYNNIEDKRMRQVLSAFSVNDKIILAHEDIDGDIKTNEIPLARKIISSFENRGVIFTLDALHCQKKL